MTLLCPENSLKAKAANPHAKTIVREEVRRRHEKFVADLEQKKCAIAAFLQPVSIMFCESLDSGKQPKTVVYARTATSLLNWTIVTQPSPFSLPKKSAPYP